MRPRPTPLVHLSRSTGMPVCAIPGHVRIVTRQYASEVTCWACLNRDLADTRANQR